MIRERFCLVLRATIEFNHALGELPLTAPRQASGPCSATGAL